MSFLLQSDFPIRHKLVVLVGPASQEIREGGPVHHVRNRVIHLSPQILERRIGSALVTGFSVLAAFEKPVHFANGYLARRPGQQISTFRSSPRFHETTLLQTGENQFEELLRDALPSSDIGDLNGLARGMRAKVEDGLQGVFTLYGNVHSAKAPISCL